MISIHAPREGSDAGPLQGPAKRRLISIHAPREGSDRGLQKSPAPPGPFLSTLPARGATRVFTTSFAAPDRFLSTLPARGATEYGRSKAAQLQISIHAPREGSDQMVPRTTASSDCDFYPRSPRGERLDAYNNCNGRCDISIHAPREGSDRW